MHEHFTRQTRDDGVSYVTLADEHPDWLYDAVHAAHDDELPNDWRYATCRSIAEMIDDGTTDAAEIADALTDVYNANLLAWVSDNLGRMAYVDEALAEGSYDTLAGALMAGQFRCIEQMAQVLLDAADEDADDAEAEEVES